MKLTVKCPMRLNNALMESAKHNDTSLIECLQRFEAWMTDRISSWDDYDSEVVVSSDFGKTDMVFTFYNGNGRVIFNGGLVFHGWKGEADESCSVTCSDKVWQIHT